jgi:hypothetical protein
MWICQEICHTLKIGTVGQMGLRQTAKHTSTELLYFVQFAITEMRASLFPFKIGLRASIYKDSQ